MNLKWLLKDISEILQNWSTLSFTIDLSECHFCHIEWETMGVVQLGFTLNFIIIVTIIIELELCNTTLNDLAYE